MLQKNFQFHQELFSTLNVSHTIASSMKTASEFSVLVSRDKARKIYTLSSLYCTRPTILIISGTQSSKFRELLRRGTREINKRRRPSIRRLQKFFFVLCTECSRVYFQCALVYYILSDVYVYCEEFSVCSFNTFLLDNEKLGM